MVDNHTELGSSEDRVHLFINGQEWRYYTTYSVKTGILAQPSSFSFTLGAARPGRDELPLSELMKVAAAGNEFQLKIGSTLVQSGLIEDRDISDTQGGTTITVSGRDWVAPLTKEYIRYEVDFGQPTYFQMTRRVLDICGLKDRKLFGDNDAHRKSVSRSVKATAKPTTDVVEQIPTNTLTNASTKVNLQRVVGKLGGTWFDFLKTQYKKVGLFLWATADGNFVLSRPTANMDPLYVLRRKRGLPRTMSNVLSWSLSDKSSSRHAYSSCFGKGANHAKGVHSMEGTWSDDEMNQRGFSDRIVEYDEDAKTPDEAEYIAKRKLAEERRDSWVLTYTVSGHTTPGLFDSGQMLIWTPDTCVTVLHEELGDMVVTKPKFVRGTRNVLALDQFEQATAVNSAFKSGQDCYIESVEFNRNPQSTTKIRVMRKQDLYFLGEAAEYESEETKVNRGTTG